MKKKLIDVVDTGRRWCTSVKASGVRGGRAVCTWAKEREEKEEEEGRAADSRPPLYRRLSALGATGESLTKTVNEYIREGRSITKSELESCVKQLRNYKRYHHALELMEWMGKRGTNFSYRDYAVLIDLMSKVKGIKSAGDYFNCLPAPAKNRFTYGALLNCYCKNKMTKKALALFEEMSELNFTSTLAYNNIMTMYVRVGEPEKVPLVVQQMKERDLSPDTFTYNVLMNSYALLKNIEGVERVLKQMESEDSYRCDWTTYSNLAAIYIDFAVIEKAEVALREVEKRIKPHDRTAYHFLISLYAGTSNLSEVHRIWKSLQSAFSNTTNMSYLVYLQALAKLDDFDGLAKCYKHWESTCSSYDMRLGNIVVSAHLRRDMLAEAKSICEDAVRRGVEPDFRTHELFLDFFMRNSQWESALSVMDVAISKVKKNEWQPNRERKSAFLKHFEEERNIDGAEEFCKMLKKVDCLDSEAFRLLLYVYISANKKEPGMRKRLEVEEIEISSEIEELLERVCL